MYVIKYSYIDVIIVKYMSCQHSNLQVVIVSSLNPQYIFDKVWWTSHRKLIFFTGGIILPQ